MSISISANVAGVRVLDVTYVGRRERENDACMQIQNAATEAQSEGLKRPTTPLDRLVEQPGVLDRFAD